MKRALVRDVDGLIANVIELKIGADWQPPSGHSVVDISDASPGDTWDGSRLVKRVVAPAPDPKGFVQAGIDAIGEDRADELLGQYPTFLPALERGNWGLARRRLAKALTDAAMTQAEHDALADLMAEHHIPA